MTTQSKEFAVGWPTVLDDMTVYLEEMLPPGHRGSLRVTLDLSSRLVPPTATRPHLDDWREEWRNKGVDIQWHSVSADRHTLRIESGKKAGLWHGILDALGLGGHADALPPVAQPSAGGPKPPRPRRGSHYELIENAISDELLYFLQTKGEAQREYAPDYVYVLESVELQALRPEADALLAELLDQPVAIRQGLVQKQLQHQLQRHYANLSVGSQCRLERVEEGTLSDGELALAMQRSAPDSAYLVFLQGHWEERPRERNGLGPVLRFEIFDREGQPRVAGLSGAETLIGREGQLRVDGGLASRRHCLLRVGDAGATLEDLGSAHGTYLDGQRLAPGQALPVAGALDIRLGTGAPGDTDYANYPRIRVTVPGPAVPAGIATPIAPVVRPDAAQATPILSMDQPAEPPQRLAELQIQDQGGRRILPIHKTPFSVGRSLDCDAIINEANTGVSRVHLSIESFTQDGANIRMTGANGAALAGEPVNPGELLWPWNQPMELAIAVKSQYPTPVLTLKRPAA